MPLQRTGRRGVSVLRLYASVAMADTMRPTCTNMAKVPPSKVHRGGAVAASTDAVKLPTSIAKLPGGTGEWCKGFVLEFHESPITVRLPKLTTCY